MSGRDARGPMIGMTPAKGWHSRGYLPHFDSPETVQFVTFRLADSLSRAVIEGFRLHDEVSRAGAFWQPITSIGICVTKGI